VVFILHQPENLLLASEGGQMKLSDVGLECFLGGQLTAAACSEAPGYLGENTTLNMYYNHQPSLPTLSSSFLHYIAPEVLMGSRGSKPGDMWALGVVLYIL